MSDPFNPYEALYVNPVGPGDIRPTAFKVLEDNDLVGNLAGKVALVTGGTSGIGVETVRALHATGASVYFTARTPEKGKAALEAIRSTSTGQGKLEAIVMDLNSLESVKAAAADFLSRSSQLNILVNNAGIMAAPESETADGYESQFGVNYLAHWVFTVTLLPTLVASATPDRASRVVVVSSVGHRVSSVHFDNLRLKGEYQPWVAYGQSKTGTTWMANYIDRVYGPKGVHANSLHPGGIATGLQQHIDEATLTQWHSNTASWCSAEQGAATTIWAATAPVWEGKGGKYLERCAVTAPVTGEGGDLTGFGYVPHTYDPEGEQKLWDVTCQLTGMTPSV